jgi:predicted PurR-regulated permease PerM
MGTLTLILVVLVILAIIGGGAGAFFGSVSQGVKNTISFVEESPTLRNLSQETQQFAQDQVSGIVKEIH